MKTIKIILSVLTIAVLSSCTDNGLINQKITESQRQVKEIEYSYHGHLKKDFAIALAHAMAESQLLRELLKKEALKTFNKDYDILYHLVKDDVLSNGKTVRETILEFFTNKKRLAEIENELPLLTIFVPDLPKDTFSAKSWNIKSEIPYVAIRLSTTNQVPIFKNDGEEFILEAPKIPAFPVVVVKENERVVVVNEKSSRNINSNYFTGAVIPDNNSDIQFRFASQVYNGINDDLNLGSTSSRINPDPCIIGGNDPTCYDYDPPEVVPPGTDEDGNFDHEIPQYSCRRYTFSRDLSTYGIPNLLPYRPDEKAIEAYNIYKNVNGWQRDYIYYDISPSDTRGPFNDDYILALKAFKLTGTPDEAYDTIADQTSGPRNDPILKDPELYSPEAAAWTDGSFEFKVDVLVNAKNGTGPIITKRFTASPEDLFHLETSNYGRRGGPPFFKTELLCLQAIRVDIPIFKWNLNEYSTSISIFIEEVDSEITETITKSRQVEFATNFEFTANLIEKVGLKFGGSIKETRIASNEVKFTQNSDPLGEVIVNFGDAVITDYEAIRDFRTGGCRTEGFRDGSNECLTVPYLRKYKSGLYTIEIVPVKVQ